MDVAGFFSEPGRCWRMIQDPDPGRGGHPLHCPGTVSWQGRFRTSEGKVFDVWSCDAHRDGIEDLRALPR